MSSKHVEKSQVESAGQPIVRKAYSRPAVTPFGSLVELTQGVSGTVTDGTIGSK